MQCKICNNASGNSVHVAREMMYAFRDQFQYLECSNCGSVHIVEIPDLSKYYPQNYYSLIGDRESALKRYLKAVRARHILFKPTVLGALLNFVYGPTNLSWLPYLTVALDAPVLDVGCGRGNLLDFLASVGFRNLTGVDPNVPESLSYSNGVQIIRGELWDVPKRDYKFIILQYSLEHVTDPIRVVRTTRAIVAEDGMVVIRIPIAGNYAWRVYKTNWASLDPPRHLYLFSEKAFTKIAEDCGFLIEQIIYDSTDFQFWGSEQLSRDIPFADPRSYSLAPNKSIFSKKQIRDYKKHTAQLNAQRDGDLATFILRPQKLASKKS
jgi:SAM-dependent methyltransferase